MSKPMKTALMLAALAAGGVARADDLAWVFDTSARTPDVTATATPAANEEPWTLRPVRSAPSDAIPLFNSCWRYDVASGGWSYTFAEGFYLLFR